MGLLILCKIYRYVYLFKYFRNEVKLKKYIELIYIRGKLFNVLLEFLSIKEIKI